MDSCCCAEAVRFVYFDSSPPAAIYTLSLHDALPISARPRSARAAPWTASRSYTKAASRSPSAPRSSATVTRSEEHTSELQSRRELVCRLLLEKKKRAPPALLPAPSVTDVGSATRRTA